MSQKKKTTTTRRKRGTTARATKRRAKSTPGFSSWFGSWRFRALLAVGVIVAIGFIWLSAPFWQLHRDLAGPEPEPSRLLERAPRIVEGEALRIGDLAAALDRRGYRERDLQSMPTPEDGSARRADLRVGEFLRSDSRLWVHLRSFPRSQGASPPVLVEADLRGGWVRELRVEGEKVRVVEYDPEEVVTYYDDHYVDRRAIDLDRLPRQVILTVLAAEDAGFFNHPGLSLSGMLRALWVNLRDQRIDQGGSTLTQQLVKNRVLTHDRTVVRKVREATVSVLVELRYSKREILEAYLNEIFWGRSGGINVVGLGAAARTYFAVPAAELSLAQAASLAAAIRSPAALSPHANLEANREVRDRLLRRLRDLEWIDEGELSAALAEEIAPASTLDRDRARYAANAAALELEMRYGIDRDRLPRAGLTILSTLVARDQERAERIVEEELAKLDSGVQEADQRRLQAALVSLDPATGGVTAWVGGRDYRASQFDRVRQARRQVGSAFKPVVLAAALEERTITVADRLLDEPITVRLANSTWRPQNDNRQWSGEVSVREVFERSLNVPTVRLAMDVGLDEVVEQARDLGVESPLSALPSLALGAFEMTPLELARVYGTFANGGLRPPVHMVDAVLGADLQPRTPEIEVAAPQVVLDPGVAYLVTSVLEGVMQRGTGQSVRRSGLADLVAGKSGTSNRGRDSWFVGYAQQRATVVWVGYDEGGAATRLSGSRGALPIWGRFMQEMRPAGGYTVAIPPTSVRSATIDPETGFLATSRCPLVATEMFLDGQVPGEACWIHGGRERRRGFWRRLFRRGGRDSP